MKVSGFLVLQTLVYTNRIPYSFQEKSTALVKLINRKLNLNRAMWLNEYAYPGIKELTSVTFCFKNTSY